MKSTNTHKDQSGIELCPSPNNGCHVLDFTSQVDRLPSDPERGNQSTKEPEAGCAGTNPVCEGGKLARSRMRKSSAWEAPASEGKIRSLALRSHLW